MTIDFSEETMEVREKCNNIYKVLEKKKELSPAINTL